jgi:hypothetical protein
MKSTVDHRPQFRCIDNRKTDCPCAGSLPRDITEISLCCPLNRTAQQRPSRLATGRLPLVLLTGSALPTQSAARDTRHRMMWPAAAGNLRFRAPATKDSCIRKTEVAEGRKLNITNNLNCVGCTKQSYKFSHLIRIVRKVVSSVRSNH